VVISAREQTPAHATVLNFPSVARPSRLCVWPVSHSRIITMATTIRRLPRADIPQILKFIRALAAYERAPEAVMATEADLEQGRIGPNPFISV